MKRDGRVRVLSLKRLVLSIILGFLFLVSYVMGLFVLDQAGKAPPNAALMVIGWPRRLWILMGLEYSDDQMLFAAIFLGAWNTALFATMIYLVLLALALVRRQPAIPESPPPPERLESGVADSD